MKVQKYIFWFIFLCILTSCIDEWNEISAGYQVGLDGDKYRALSGGFISIKPRIVSEVHNDEFILISQLPLKFKYILPNDINKVIEIPYYRIYKNVNYSHNSTYDSLRDLFDSKFSKNEVWHFYEEESDTLVYYILHISEKGRKDDRLYGPFTKDEYLHKRIELNVPDGLQLNDNEHFDLWKYLKKKFSYDK